MQRPQVGFSGWVSPGGNARDPHGDPIPSRDLDLDPDDTVPLAELETGAGGTFERISDSDPEMLRYLDARGIRPGVELSVIGREPFEGPVTVVANGDEHALGSALVRSMYVTPLVPAGARDA